MRVTVTKHFDYLTPFSEAENDDELEKILRLKYPKACSNLEIDAAFFAKTVEDIRRDGHYRVLGYGTFAEFCEEELGQTLDEVERIVGGVKALKAAGHVGPITPEDLLDVVEKIERPGQGARLDLKPRSDATKLGRGKDYLAKRIADDHPDIAERMRKGEFPSVRQAAIAAGIVKVQTPVEKAVSAYRRLSEQERDEFHQLIKCKPDQT